MTGIGVELLGVIAVGVGAAALLYAGMHLLRKLGLAPARWLLPAGIGLAMVSYAVWNDYAWYDRAVARLPADAQILLVGRDSQPWAPWTYLAPVVIRFAALDPAGISETAEGIRRAGITLVERRGPTLVVPQEFDCAKGLVRPARGAWSPPGPSDPAYSVVCGGGG
ncbi:MULTISPECIES: hypothetical protein [Paracoccus]|jgi:hypothetical protein|uniref:hypothetical protein n=1 Tax=Paracoccus TaxID=265 RepID=UPI000CEBB069|nr:MULTISPECIES: hypothetical protein [Paracoccus]MDK8875231.1 hypothetical protein [Paracoccus sp. SSJ]UFS67891.1 hypothetical protein LO749_23145 [Paracoccus denitrificans]